MVNAMGHISGEPINAASPPLCDWDKSGVGGKWTVAKNDKDVTA